MSYAIHHLCFSTDTAQKKAKMIEKIAKIPMTVNGGNNQDEKKDPEVNFFKKNI